MSHSAVPSEEKVASFWRDGASMKLKNKLNEKLNKNKAKNGIFFIGDGMSVATIMAARTYAGQINPLVQAGEQTVLSFEDFPVTGLAKTYCLDAQVADSACTATSYLTGVKSMYGTIGINGNVTRGSCHAQLFERNLVSSLAQWALDNDLDTGFVTTTRVTHASPAGMYAHTSERNWESDADVPAICRNLGCKDIAHQLIHHEPGNRFKVIMGGGRREMLSTDAGGRRTDSRDLIEEWVADKTNKNVSNEYVSDRDQLMKIYNSKKYPEYLLGLYQMDHMEYHLKSDQTQPTLEEMTEVAIAMLSRNPKGYFLFVEGGRIDHAHHDSLARLALDETVEFSKAIQKAKDITSEEDTLIVVSSDHAHTMSVAGYPSRGNDILGVVDTSFGMDNKPYTTISYANGKGISIGADGTRVDVTLNPDFNNRDVNYAYPGIVPLDSETHGGEDVAVFASGPWQHLFTANYEQNLIPHMIAYAMCLGDEKHENCKHVGFGDLFGRSSARRSEVGIISVILTVMLCLRYLLV